VKFFHLVLTCLQTEKQTDKYTYHSHGGELSFCSVILWCKSGTSGLWHRTCCNTVACGRKC